MSYADISQNFIVTMFSDLFISDKYNSSRWNRLCLRITFFDRNGTKSPQQNVFLIIYYL